ERRLNLIARAAADIPAHPTLMRRRIGSVLLGYADGAADHCAEQAGTDWTMEEEGSRSAARVTVIEVLSRIWSGPIPTAIQARGATEPRLSDFLLATLHETAFHDKECANMAAAIDLSMIGFAMV